MPDPDDDTVLTPHQGRIVRPGLDSEDTIVRPWVVPPPSQPDVADVLAAIDRARSIAEQARDESGSSAEAPAPADGPVGYYGFRIGEFDEPTRLEVPAYIGRRPSSPRIRSGVVPRLVSVHSPEQEVSGTHLEIRQLGTSVIVTDMKSTNGTLVIAPGSAPRKLRQGESVVVSPGTLVDIGDGNLIEILPVQGI